MSDTALVTGASRGIGRRLARCFAREGTDVILVARSEGDLVSLKEELEAEHGIRAHVMPRDLTDEAAREDLVREVEERGLHVRTLVNNAGFGEFAPYASTSWDRLGSMIELNITAPSHLARVFLPAMIERGEGEVLNVASTAAFQPGPFMAVYYASKAYLLSLSEALSYELKDRGVTVSCLCPGPTRTGFQEEANMADSDVLDEMPVWYEADDVAEYGYEALKDGEPVAVHGWFNYLLVTLVRFLPRSTVRSLVGSRQKAHLSEAS